MRDALDNTQLRGFTYGVAESLCKQQSVFLYLFKCVSPLREGILGSCFGLEIPYMFGTFNGCARDVLSQQGPVDEHPHEDLSLFAGAHPDTHRVGVDMRKCWTRCE